MGTPSEILIYKRVKGERVVVAKGWGTGYFPVVVKLDSGELVAAIRGGAEHMGVGGRLDLVRSKDGGKTWSQPKVAIDTPNDDRNPAFGQCSDGTLIMAYVSVAGYVKGYVGHRGTPDYKFRDYLIDVWVPSLSRITCHYTLSMDNGETWSKSSILELPGYKQISPYGRIIETPDKTLLMNMYAFDSSEGKSRSFLLCSRDRGRSWDDPSLIGVGLNEASFLSLPSGKILAAIRSDEPDEATYVSVSSDKGYNWSKPKKVTDSLEHAADLSLLGDGRVLMVYGYRKHPFGVRALISDDQGETWNHERGIILADDSDSQDCGYPSAVRLDDGTVLILYYLVGSHRYPDIGTHCAAIRIKEDLL